MSTTGIQLAPIFLPRPPPSLRQPAPPLPVELLFTILDLATADGSTSFEHQQTRIAFSGVSRGWYQVAAAQPMLVVKGAGQALRLASVLQEKHATLRAVRNLHLIIRDGLHDPERRTEILYERCDGFAEVIEACPEVDRVELVVPYNDEVEVPKSLLEALRTCKVSTFEVTGMCTMPAPSLYRLFTAWPSLQQFLLLDLRLHCYRSLLSSPLSLSLPLLGQLSIAIEHEGTLSILSALLKPVSLPKLYFLRLASNSVERGAVAAVVNEFAPQLRTFAYEDEGLQTDSNQYAFEPVLSRMAQLQVLIIPAHFVHPSTFLGEVVPSKFLHLERLRLSPTEGLGSRLTSQSVFDCLHCSRSLSLLWLPSALLRHWHSQDRLEFRTEARKLGVDLGET